MIKTKSKVILTLIFIMIISIVASLSAMTGIAFADSNSSDFKNGHGTADSPYEITSVEEFNNVRYHREAHFKQMNNLDFGNTEFGPIGSVTFPFTGHYDGGKYQISNIHIKQKANNVGLFAFVDNIGVIENLKLVNAEIEGEYNVGSFAGTNRGTIIGCVSSAKVSGNGAVGGIVGLNAAGGKTQECGNTGNIFSTNENGMYVGGIVGINNSLVQDCYNHGKINSDKNFNVTYVGGITGLNNGESYNAEIDRCYNIGEIIGNARGQVAGDNLKGGIYNSKWQTSELNKVASFDSGNISDTNVLSSNSFTTANSFNGWDFDKTWKYIKTKSEYPLLNREYVKVESVSFKQSEMELRQGNSLKLEAVVTPIHATENTAKLELNSNITGVKLSQDNILSVSKSVTPGTKISIKAKAESLSTNLTVTVTKIPVESVELTNLDGKNEISQLHGLHFKGEVKPYDATYKGIRYEVDSSFAEITSDGFLTLKENAPTGAKITVTAVSTDDNLNRDSITVTVVKESVTSVAITSANNFKLTGSLKLTATVLPNEATYKDVTYKIIASTADGANLTDNVLTAKGLGIITVIAEADGVKSEEFKIQVLKEPVTDIVWNIKDRFTCGDILVLNATAIPANATFSEIQYSIIGDNTARASIIDGVLHAETAGTVIVRAIADEFVSDKEITIDKVPVENIELNFADSFKHTESLTLNVNVTPDNATYKDNIVYEIISDSADSRIVSGVLYANIPGTVVVKVTVDGISAEKIISVLKEPVQSISMNAVFKENDSGEAYQFVASIYPATATNQDVVYVLKSGAATLSETGLLLIDPSAPVGSLIEVYAIVDGIESSVYEIKSGRISVKSVSLTADSYSIKVGEGLSLVTSTVPAVVSNPGVTYIVEGNAELIDGVLYVFDTEAVGTIINVKAIVDGVESSAISVNVIETPVENITFTCATSFKVTGSLKLSASVYPQNATDKTVTFTIVSGSDIGAEIVDGYLYAEKVGVVKVRAVAGNVSRDVVICVQKEPVTRVVLTSSLSVKVNNELKLAATVYPFNATYKDITFELIDNDISVELINGNILFSSQVGTVVLRVNADGTYEDYRIEITKEPVTGIVFGKTAFKHTESLDLVTRVLPTNATFNAVSYMILKNYAGYEDIGARIENGKLYANRPGIIKLLINTDNGDYSEPIEIEVTKEPVIGINMNNNVTQYLDYGYRVGQIDLETIVYPYNATYKDVKYSIVPENCTYELNGKILTVTLEALKISDGIAEDKQASITVKAVADGVEFYKTYVFHKFDLANENEIELDTSVRTFKTSGQFGFKILLPEKITYKGIKVEIINQGNTGAKFGHTDNSASIEIDENFKDSILLAASLPGTFTLRITSLCDGKTINDFEFIVEEEKINNVYLGIEGESKYFESVLNEKQLTETANYQADDISDFKLYKSMHLAQGEQISLRAFANALDVSKFATYGKTQHLKIYYLDEDGNKLSADENNIYFTRKEETLTINENAPVTAKIKLFAAFEGGNVNSDYDVVSDYIELTIESAYIKDIENVSIERNGLITGMNQNDFMKRVHILIEHSLSGIVIEKTIETNDPHLQLNLYNQNLGGEFNITYKAFFEQQFGSKIYKYNYTFPNVTKFSGLKNSYNTQTANHNTYNSIALLDYYQNAKTVTEVGSNVKVLYVYGNAYQTRTASFKFNCSADIYLDNFSFTSSTGNDAITIGDNQTINLFTKGNITIKASNGNSTNKNGSNVIYGPDAKLTIYNEASLTLIAGNGANGNGGVSHDRYEENGGSGTAPSGGSGNDGGSGGIAIKCDSLNLSTENGSLSISGGNGGNGGNGGDGHGSDRDGRPKAGNGGRGGDGGIGGAAISVTNSLVLNVSANLLDVSSGNGGNGGAGGHGGNGPAYHYSDHGGDGGCGGNAGAGGNAIQATSLNVISSSGTMSIQTGNGGKGGRGGDGGYGTDSWGKSNNGNGANGGNSGNSGSVIVSSFSGNKTHFNNCITIGTVCFGGFKGSNGTGNGNAASGSPRDGYAGTVGKKVS